jgi:hypothetical protein
MDATDKCPGFAQLPRALMRQFPSPYVWAVYACIHDHGWGSADGCWASIQTMSAETGVNHHKIREVLKVLDAHGWITTEMRPGRSTVYRPRLEASLQSDPFKKSKGSPLLQESEGVAQQVQMPPVQEIEGGPLQECEGPPLQDLEDKQEPNNKNPTTRTPYKSPPYPPHGGDGLAAVDRSEGGDRLVSISLEEQPQRPTAERPANQQPTAEQPAAIVPAQPRGTRARTARHRPPSEEAHRLTEIWNAHKPPGWNSLTCVNSKRWEVVEAFARDLGGLEAFLAALPLALHNASQDRFWRGPGHDWNSFMGYGGQTSKGHFLRFLEQEAPRVPTVNRDGSLTAAGMALEPDLPHLF